MTPPPPNSRGRPAKSPRTWVQQNCRRWLAQPAARRGRALPRATSNAPGRRRDCHSADTPLPVPIESPARGGGGCRRMTARRRLLPLLGRARRLGEGGDGAAAALLQQARLLRQALDAHRVTARQRHDLAGRDTRVIRGHPWIGSRSVCVCARVTLCVWKVGWWGEAAHRRNGCCPGGGGVEGEHQPAV